jgi:phosphoribosylamine-glycine ligase
MVSGDPGKKFLLYMMDNDGNELKYSCMQRDTESLAKRNRRIMKTNKENSNIIEHETILSNYCSKTIHYNKFKDFIKAKYDTNIETKKFYEAPVFRKLNWRTKTYRQKSEDKFLNNISTTFGNKEEIVICIGDWSNKNTLKGLASTMGIGLKRLIHKKFTTLQIDEYNTSKKYISDLLNII